MKIQYTPPILTVVDFRTERGYAFSSLQETIDQLIDRQSTTSSLEQFEYQSGWSQSDGDGFWTNGNGGYF
ncbi:MAG: hypothetical protein IJ761_06750 [Bacteroidales bacterium]|nr:hypothetical protein [Bacteroidales bacterium]